MHATFDKFFAGLRKNLEAVEARLAAKASQSQTPEQSQQSQQSPTAVGAEESFIVPPSQQTNGGEAKEVKPAKDQELRDRRTEYGVAWIVYMRFARRAEGVKSARAVFGKSRKDRWTPWEVYEAAALMEYHCTKAADVAGRIFERGMETFPDEVELALRYLGFLITINDDANARALFERAVNNFPPEKARPIWDRWARYEYQYGTLEACHLLEKRMAEVYPQDPPIKRFAERHKYLGCDAIAVRDLGFTFGRGNGSANKTEAQPTPSPTTQPSSQAPPAAAPAKRPVSPDHRRRDESRSSSDYPPSKRQRPVSPPRGHDRDRWGDGRGRGRYASPSPWERERERDGGHGRKYEREREEDKSVAIPPVLSWFVGMLPSPASFDGPVFRTDDLMQVFRSAVIPSSSPVVGGAGGARPRSPPPPHRGGGRPPPDYSPYTGPGGGRRGRY